MSDATEILMNKPIAVDIENLLKPKYLAYAESVITDRAVPFIDGFKPVQRRIMYSMYELGAEKGKRKKSARIVGDTMGKYHPHGDISIYEALCAMEETYDGCNAPLIDGQGSFGHSWSNPKLDGGMHAAKMRYTEAGLTDIALELFDGIKEGAVEFVPNYDETEKEPVILPTKFPNILVNANSGVAVGMSSAVPTYGLRETCLAVAAVLKGKNKPEDIVDILGAPDFSVGGTIHTDRALLLNLLNTGNAKFTVTGSMHRAGDDIIVDSVPEGVSVEKVMLQLKELAQSPDGKEITDVISNVGKGTSGIMVKVKKGSNLRNLALKIYQRTDVRTTVNFITKIIWNGAPVEIGVMDLIDKWIYFRSDCVRNVYVNKAEKLAAEEHKKSAWETIYNDVVTVANTIATLSEAEARQLLAEKYGLDEEQLDYIFNLKIKTICKDKADEELAALKGTREKLAFAVNIRDNDTARYNLIASELETIAARYGSDRKCKVDELVPEEEKIRVKTEIPDKAVTVCITKRGFIKCITDTIFRDGVNKYLEDDDELLVRPIYTSLKDTILVYTYGGYCYKVPVINIESSRTGFKQYVWDIVDRRDNNPILFACAAGDYSGVFTLVYGSGRGTLVFNAECNGKNKVYKNRFLPGTNKVGDPNRVWVVPYTKFFMITEREKAAYANAEYVLRMGGRKAFKVGRVMANDPVMWFLDASKVDTNKVDMETYCRDICIKARDEELLRAIRENKPEDM